jgi:hypothetical protein
MIKKTIVVIAASALACGLWASAASAKTTKPKAKRASVAKVEPMKSVPGNNPFTVAAKRDVPKNAPKPETIKGNNAMTMASTRDVPKNAPKPEAIKGNNAMTVPAK